MASTPEKHGRYWRTKWRHNTAGTQTFRHIDKHHVDRFIKWLDGVVDERQVTQDDERIESRAYLVGGAEEVTLARLARELVAARTKSIEQPIKKGSVDAYDDRIRRFGFLGDVPFEDITPDLVQEFVHRMRTEPRPHTRRPYAANTIRETVSLMKQTGAWARKHGRVDVDPFVDIQLPKGPLPKKHKFLTFDQYTRLHGYGSSEQFLDMMDLIATSTGMRIGEVLALRVDDLGNEGGYDTLRVDETLTARNGYGPTKTGLTRVLDIDPGTAAMLRKWCADRSGSMPIFLNSNRTGPVSYNAFASTWERMVVRALKDGIMFPDDVPTTHWLRHSYAAWFLSAKDEHGNYVGNIYDLQKRLGHSSIQITIDRYGHLDPQARERAYSAVTAVKRSVSLSGQSVRHLRAIG